MAWRGDGVVKPDDDKSAGEFDLAPTAFGVHGFKTSAASGGTIEARLGEATGTLTVTARP